MGTKMYIRWLLLWTGYRKDNKDKDINWNNWKTWTHEEFREFKLACRRGDIRPNRYAHEPRIFRTDRTPGAKNNIIMVQKCQIDGTKNSCASDESNNGYHVPCMSNNDINTTNARVIDKINHVPCANNNIKCDIHDTCAINYDIITLNKNNHQKHGIEPSPLSNQQNVTTLNKSARTQELLIKEASNMEKLMNNAIEMEQL